MRLRKQNNIPASLQNEINFADLLEEVLAGAWVPKLYFMNHDCKLFGITELVWKVFDP